MITREARGRPRVRAYSNMTSGVRCADTIRTSYGDAELDEHVDRALHHRQVGVAAHDHADAAGCPRRSTLMDTCRDAHTTDRDARDRAPRDARRDGRRLVPRASSPRSPTRAASARSARRRCRRSRSTTRSAACASSPTSRSVSTCSPRCPSGWSTTRTRSSRAARRCSSPGSACRATSIKVLHDGNVLVASMCGKVRHAIAAVEAGCDFVIAQGTEAGGHTGTVATMPLVPQIVDAVGDRVPVVAAGGIFDGRGLAAALALGADGVWLGTRFIATPEARTVRRLQGRAAARARGRHRHQPRLHRQDAARGPQRVDAVHRGAPRGAEPFPEQMGKAVAANALHLGGDENTPRRPRQGVLPVGPGRRRDRRARSRPATSCARSSPRPSTRSPAPPSTVVR